ncbi:MAG: GvpL/GvpF family gas vesicle protein [Bacteroidales bacterium]|nr:GvpL/GvpF family gas vesicle protein [Bacteroidales bacterium]
MMNIEGLYLYGIIPTYYSCEQFRELDKLNVLNIPFGKVSVIAAEEIITDYRDLDTEQLARLLVSHQQTIESIMHLGFNTIIPVRLGTFAFNASQVKKIVKTGYDLILETFEKISGFMEFDLVVTWADFNKVLGEIAVDSQVMEMKAKIEQNQNITQADQMAIGHLVKKILDQRKDDLAGKIFNALEPYCQSVKQHEVQNDQMVSNTAFMVNRQQQALLEKAIDELDLELNGKHNFKLVGPLACYSFYTMEVEQLKYDDLLAAKEELEPGDSISEKSIRQAYLKKVKLFHPDQNPDDVCSVIFNQIQQAYQTLLSYVQSQNLESDDEIIVMSPEVFTEDTFILKIKD